MAFYVVFILYLVMLDIPKVFSAAVGSSVGRSSIKKRVHFGDSNFGLANTTGTGTSAVRQLSNTAADEFLASKTAPVNNFEQLASAIPGKVQGFIGSTMLDYFITRFIQVNKMDGFTCTVKITHNLAGSNLVNPKIYLDRGTTKTPPVYKIESGVEKSEEKFAVFDADDKITKRDFVSSGILTYEIGTKYVLYVVWKVAKHGTFMLGDGKNSFYFLVKKRSELKSPWTATLKKEYDMAQPLMYQASEIGHLMELDQNAPDGSLEFKILAHMSNDKNALLILSIERPNPLNVLEKREFMSAMSLSALFTVAGALTKMALRHLPTETQRVVVTIQNDFADRTLDEPQWHLKSAVIVDYIPFSIPPQSKKQVTFSVPFAYSENKIKDKTKHSAIVLAFRIKGGFTRLALAIWWGKKFSASEATHYSAFTFGGKPADDLMASIAKNRLQNGAGITESIPVKEYQNYQCKENQYEVTESKGGVQTRVTKLLRIYTTMGNSRSSSMIVAVGDRPGNKFDLPRHNFQDCFEL